MLRHLQVACSYALRKTAEDNGEDIGNDVLDADDCLKSLPTKDEAIGLVQELPELLSRGEFRLTKCLLNEREILSHVADRGAPCVSLHLETLPKH